MTVPLVVAHRGASWDEPENTIAAFLRAIEVGADYVELDVHAASAASWSSTTSPTGGSSCRPWKRCSRRCADGWE